MSPGVPNARPIRARLSRLFPPGHSARLGPLTLGRRSDGLILGPTRAHPTYGERYQEEPLPPGLTPDQLQAYVSRTGWYHQIDLGNGVLTPGGKSKEIIAREWQLFALGDLTGKTVLDIGGIDGGFAFLAEQNGASRSAVLDHYLWATDAENYSRIYRQHVAAGAVPPAPHESDAWHPETTPTRWRFDTARQALGSKVEAMVLDFSDCDLAAVGVWDVVLYLGVLYHMPDPVRALSRVAAVTREQAIIETEAMLIHGHPEALWRFFPQGELNSDRSNWWVPNLNALLGLIGAAGFSNAEILAGEPTDNRAGDGPHHYRAIVRAIK
jgi:tRNA (mo5U34)-methyltransferase